MEIFIIILIFFLGMCFAWIVACYGGEMEEITTKIITIDMSRQDFLTLLDYYLKKDEIFAGDRITLLRDLSDDNSAEMIFNIK